jgi:GT2 family glycosyltransferase
MISVICVYNNKKILENCLLKSIKNQTTKVELILLDNRKGRFKSAAEALNYGGKQAKGKYLMFVHQDMILNSRLWIEKVERMLGKLPNFGVVGVAGKCKNAKVAITNITHGIPKQAAGEIHIKKPEKVQTVDECLIIISKTVFNILQFDEKVCSDWHLYAVDYCLSVKKLGFDSYVIPIFAYHKSLGHSMSKKYFIILKKILKKHKNCYKMIYTTVGNWSTAYPVCISRVYFWSRKRVGRLLRKTIWKVV